MPSERSPAFSVMDQASTGQAKGTVHIVGVLAPKRILYAAVVGKRMTMTKNRKLSTCFRPVRSPNY